MIFFVIGLSLYWLCKKNRESDSNIYAILFWLEILILIVSYFYIDSYLYPWRYR